MKIMNGSAAPKPTAATATSRTNASKATSTAPSTGATTSATSTGVDRSDQLSQLEAQFSQADFNVSKVSEITAAIASGKYQVNTGAIADKLLQSTAALSGQGDSNS